MVVFPAKENTYTFINNCRMVRCKRHRLLQTTLSILNDVVCVCWFPLSVVGASRKSGGVASEKQVALDILMIKQMIEEQTISLRWVPTWKQIADPMTKEMSGTLLDSFRNHPFLCLVLLCPRALMQL